MDPENQQADEDDNAAFESDGLVESGEEGEGNGEVDSQEEFKSSYNEDDDEQLDEVSTYISIHVSIF